MRPRTRMYNSEKQCNHVILPLPHIHAPQRPTTQPTRAHAGRRSRPAAPFCAPEARFHRACAISEQRVRNGESTLVTVYSNSGTRPAGVHPPHASHRPFQRGRCAQRANLVQSGALAVPEAIRAYARACARAHEPITKSHLRATRARAARHFHAPRATSTRCARPRCPAARQQRALWLAPSARVCMGSSAAARRAVGRRAEAAEHTRYCVMPCCARARALLTE
eukprot:IDg21534t1